jgi:hypothetical protein
MPAEPGVNPMMLAAGGGDGAGRGQPKFAHSQSVPRLVSTVTGLMHAWCAVIARVFV